MSEQTPKILSEEEKHMIYKQQLKEQTILIQKWFDLYFTPYFDARCAFRQHTKLVQVTFNELKCACYAMMKHNDSSFKTKISDTALQKAFEANFNAYYNCVYLPEELADYLKRWKNLL